MEISAVAPDLREALLAWWQPHGRHWIPWKLRPDGSPPQAGEPLDPWPIWSAEAKQR
jgi:A/G-specific adenine glycosylase